MPRTAVPVALRDRLGHDGSLALVELLESEKVIWRDDVLSLAEERFERRLAQSVADLRLEFHDGLAALRVELHQGLATTRVEIFKWSFVFWVGQVAATGLLLAYMLRGIVRQ